MKDVSLKLFGNYFQENRLGEIYLEIPNFGKISISLSKLYATIDNLNETKMDNIESIVLYGSVLYKHFPLKKETISLDKKWIFWGEEQFYEKTIPRKMPNDLDLMIITSSSSDKEKIIETEKLQGSYGSYPDPKKIIVKTEQKYLDESYGWLSGNSVDTMDLHVSYRGIGQLKVGLGKGDTVSESVINYGLPIFGIERFDQIIKNIKFPKRENLHEIQWEFNKKGKLAGKII